MMSEQQIVLATDHHDGFSDPNYGGSRSIIKGSKIKFTNDAHWLADGDEIDPARKFLAVQIDRVVQRWEEQRPVETIVLKPEENPRIDERNDAVPREEWRERFGKLEGPYQFSYVVYLLDPETMAVFTYPTSTCGGYQAIGSLKDATQRARKVHGANFFPLVTLGKVHMNTAFGGRQAPAFVVKTFVPIGPAPEPAPTIAGPEAPTIDAKKTAPERGDSDAEMKDAIRY
jgi:hypothetical protein